MTKNTLLNTGIIICKLLRLFQIIAFIILTAVFVHLQISSSTYKNIYIEDMNLKNNNVSNINEASSFVINLGSSKIYVGTEVTEGSEVLSINNIKTSSLIFNFIKLSAILFLSFLCLKEFQKVIESVKEIKTFQKRNVSSFRSIGKYLLIIFILVSYSSISFQQGGTNSLDASSFNISFELPILALLAYIMAEVFKEGNMLSEENNLTV